MPRRVETELRVTFFSFQDIMMCLTGIMIIIALLLILDFLMTSRRPGAAAPRAAGDAQSVDDDIALLQDNLKELQAREKSLSDELTVQSDVDSNEMRRELEDLQRRKAELEKGRAATTADREALQRNLKEARARREQIEKVLRGIEHDYDAAEMQASRISIATPENDNGKPWIIIQPDANSLLIAPLTSALNAIALPGETPDARCIKLGAALSSYSPNDVNLLVIVKPGAFGQDSFIVEMLQRMRFVHIGTQPIDDDSWVICTSRPSASAGGAR